LKLFIRDPIKRSRIIVEACGLDNNNNLSFPFIHQDEKDPIGKGRKIDAFFTERLL
jgi:hypothetical protein